MNKYVILVEYPSKFDVFPLVSCDGIAAIDEAEFFLKNNLNYNDNDIYVVRICKKNGTVTTSVNGTQSQMYDAVMCSHNGVDWHLNDHDHAESNMLIEVSKDSNGKLWVSAI